MSERETLFALRRWWRRHRRYRRFFNRCAAMSPDGERCKYRRNHDATGEPHSWTRFGFGGLFRGL